MARTLFTWGSFFHRFFATDAAPVFGRELTSASFTLTGSRWSSLLPLPPLSSSSSSLLLPPSVPLPPLPDTDRLGDIHAFSKGCWCFWLCWFWWRGFCWCCWLVVKWSFWLSSLERFWNEWIFGSSRPADVAVFNRGEPLSLFAFRCALFIREWVEYEGDFTSVLSDVSLTVAVGKEEGIVLLLTLPCVITPSVVMIPLAIMPLVTGPLVTRLDLTAQGMRKKIRFWHQVLIFFVMFDLLIASKHLKRALYFFS